MLGILRRYGWMKGEIWFNLVYSQVVSGSPRRGCNFHMLIRAYFLSYLMAKYICLYVVFYDYYILAISIGYDHVL